MDTRRGDPYESNAAKRRPHEESKAQEISIILE